MLKHRAKRVHGGDALQVVSDATQFTAHEEGRAARIASSRGRVEPARREADQFDVARGLARVGHRMGTTKWLAPSAGDHAALSQLEVVPYGHDEVVAPIGRVGQARHVRSFVLAVALALAACSRPSPSVETKGAPNAAAPAIDAAPTAASSEPDLGPLPPPRAWVRYNPKPFDPGATPNSPSEEVPDWDFGTDLPAIDAAGTHLYGAFGVDMGMSTQSNLGIVTVSAADDEVLDTTWMLQGTELDKAMTGTVPAKRTALASLTAVVQSRVAAENTKLNGERLNRPSACTVSAAASGQMPCSMAQQKIQCGAMAVEYGAQTLVFHRPDGEQRQSHPNWKGQTVQQVPRRECFKGAFVDEKRSLFAGKLVAYCQGGGDWCGSVTTWHVVHY